MVGSVLWCCSRFTPCTSGKRLGKRSSLLALTVAQIALLGSVIGLDGKAFAGVERLRLANEKSIKENIKQFITRFRATAR